MNEQVNRHKEEESRKTREIAQLRKEQRKQSNAIKSLQTQSAVKDQVLKRRIEEVAALKRDRLANLSAKAAGRVAKKNNVNVIFNPKQARTKWETMQKTINRAARTKQVNDRFVQFYLRVCYFLILFFKTGINRAGTGIGATDK